MSFFPPLSLPTQETLPCPVCIFLIAFTPETINMPSISSSSTCHQYRRRRRHLIDSNVMISTHQEGEQHYGHWCHWRCCYRR
jgi:hypothetical protein